MRHLFFQLILAILATSVSAIPEPPQKPTVAVIVSPYDEFVKALAQDTIDVVVFIPQSQDPHTYELKPSQMKAITEIDGVIAINGQTDFEQVWLSRIQKINPKIAVFPTTSTQTGPNNRPIHPWLSPKSVHTIVEAIKGALCKLTPSQCAMVTANYARYIKTIDALDDYATKKLKRLTKRAFLSEHNLLDTLSRDYGLVEIPIKRDNMPVTLAKLKEVIVEATTAHATLIIATRSTSPELRMIKDAISGTVIQINPFEKPYPQAIRKLIDHLSTQLSQ